MPNKKDQRSAEEEFERMLEEQYRSRRRHRESMRKAAWFERIESLPFGAFIHSILALLLFDIRTRIAAICCVALLIFVGITIPKIWRTTPDSVGDARISLLDMAQSWALARTARKASEAEEYDAARYSWHSSIANDIGNRGHIREFLETELSWVREDSSNIDPYAASYAEYLLQLSSTNRADLRLAVQLYGTIGLWERLVTLVEGTPEKDRGLEENIGLVKGYFGQALFTQFQTAWLSLPDAAKLSGDLEGYRLAYQSVWGSEAVRDMAVRSFRARVRDPEASTQLVRIWAQVALARSNLDDYELALNALDLAGERALSDDVRHWVLTAEVEGYETARELARRSAMPARTPNEAKFMTQGLITLGMTEEVRPFLEEYVSSFGASLTFAPLYLTSLLRENDWSALIEYCLALRRSPLANIGWFSTYIAGIEAIARDPRSGKGLVRSAWERFDRGDKNLPAPLGLQLAQSFSQRGEFERAQILVDALKPQSSEATGYWEVALRVASGRGDAEGLLEASRTLGELAPQLLDYQLAHALALIYANRDVSQAYDVLQQLADVAQAHPKTRLTRAMLLLHEGKVDEADAELSQVTPDEGEALSLPTLRLLESRVAVAREQWERADQLVRDVDFSLLSYWERQTFADMLASNPQLRPVPGVSEEPIEVE